MIRCLLVLLFAVQAASALDTGALERVPIQEGGRKKPYLVFAEESAMGISGKTSLKLGDRKMGAMEAVTAMWLAPEGWLKQPIILVNHQGLKQAMGLDMTRKLFSYQELAGNAALVGLLREGQAQRMKPGNQRLSGLPKEASELGNRLSEFESLADGSAFRFVPNPKSAEGQWSPASPEQIQPLRTAWAAGDQAAFTAAAAKFRQEMAQLEPQFQPPAWKIALETYYQKVHPFRWAWICYLAAGLVLLFVPGRVGYILAWVLAAEGFLFQIGGFAARVIIAGRAPVTNMYESVVWVAFGTVFFALVFEAIYRSRYFLLGAAPVAVVTLILADTQTVALNRSLSPLVPVLRDNFWLTTHVLTITLSYAAFFLAMGIGHIALGRAVLGRAPSAALYNYLYRVLQVGVLLLATGTILGAVWANYSWGRFWDWDPKETWALITLLVYLFVLHGRIAGRWGGFGLSVGAVVCFLSVLMAWYGVNFVLGVGLHSYGFGTGGFGYALAFAVVELAFVSLAIVRHRREPKAKRHTLEEEGPQPALLS